MRWRALRVSDCGTHHVDGDGRPAYAPRFDDVLKFHAPGMAPVSRGGQAWHILPSGSPAYARRFKRTFGFYQDRAAVMGADGWHHIGADGEAINADRWAWCGNYQDGRCTVRSADGRYHHVTLDGEAVYTERWAYAGDYRNGIAVVQRADGLHTHIDRMGRLVHERWFVDLDVFHKGFARARDARGWCHITRAGRPYTARRFAAVEPFYNGQARVERFDGALEVIDECGRVVQPLRAALREDPRPSTADRLAATGFALVPHVFDGNALHALRCAVRTILDRGAHEDLLLAADGHARKILYPLDKHPAFLIALADPALMRLALSLSKDPEGLVLTWEDVLLKPARIGLDVPPHQDIALQTCDRGVFSLGVHLDDAVDNPLQFLPGSHVNGPLTRAQMKALATSKALSTVRPLAGDVLAHDVLTIHRSDANAGDRPRWTWYLEYRTLADAPFGPWPAVWWRDRRAALFHAAAAREASGLDTLWPPCGPGETREGWLARRGVLRVPHEAHGISFDPQSPFHHFGDE